MLDKAKELFLSLAVIVIALLAWQLVGNYKELDKLQVMYESAEAKLSDTLSRAKTSEVTAKELNQQVKSLISENDILKEDIRKLKAKIKSLGNIILSVSGTTTTQTGFPNNFDYQLANGMKVANHSYDGSTFISKTYDLKIGVKVVTTEDKKGNTNNYVESTIGSSAEDVEYPIKTRADFIYTKPKTAFRMDPHLNLGVEATLLPIKPQATIGLSLASIGHTTDDNTYRFGNINASIGKDFSLGIDPVGINIGRATDLRLINDTWLWGGVDLPVITETPTDTATPTISLTSTL